MKWTYGIVAGSAAALLAGAMLCGCEGDESAPSRPRAQGVLAPDQKAKDNAFNRETEAPKRDLPTSGAEYPGQSRATPPAPAPGEAPVLTADAGSFAALPYGSFRAPQSDYTGSYYPGLLPPLAENPGATPAAGSTPVPNISLSIGHSWGEVLPMENYPHRAWPDMQTTYVAAVVKHNPVYYSDIQDRLPIQEKSGWIGSWTSNALEVPWFYANTLALPVLMVLEPPFLQRTTQRLGSDPIYHNYLPVGGAIIPSPTPGVIKWDYPFLREQENNPASDQLSTEPATTQTQQIPPVAPTLNTPATTAPLSH